MFKLVFDKDLGDRLATYIPDTIAEKGMSEDDKESLEEAIRNAFKKAREKAEQADKALQEQLAQLNDKAEALENMKLVKIYPRHPLVEIKPYCVYFYFYFISL